MLSPSFGRREYRLGQSTRAPATPSMGRILWVRAPRPLACGPPHTQVPDDDLLSATMGYSWASARGKSQWRDLEFFQDAIAGPISSVAKTGGCEYVYSRHDQYFGGVENPNALRLRLIQWHSELASRIDRFEPVSSEEVEDLIFMRSTADKMRDAIQRAVDLELKRWRAEHSG